MVCYGEGEGVRRGSGVAKRAERERTNSEDEF